MSAFTTTQWTVVLAAGQAGAPGAAEGLCPACLLHAGLSPATRAPR